jgi:homoserine O-acetyltransferase/O-succinyltransferase
MTANMPFSISTFPQHKISKFTFATIALTLVTLLAPTSRAQQATQSATPSAPASPPATQTYKPLEGDYVAHDFHFKSGETLPELRLHYRTLGSPARDANGRVTNAVLILHGTGGWGGNFLVPQFAGVLYGPGQLLDITHYYIIMPDNIGHGKSSKPSDGMHAHFPQYEYDDMVAAQHELVEKGLSVNHLRLIMGTSMGCMHSWIWSETYPDFMDALMPLACLPVQIAGRNRLWRQMLMDGIRQDPDWQNGDYTTEPRAGLEIAADMLLIAGGAPLPMQQSLPTREAADRWLQDVMKRQMETLDANDLLYAVNASRNYDPSAGLGKISVPVMFVNSADDFINPPELGIAEREIQKVKNGKFILLPLSDQTHGHGTHTWAALWQQYLKELLEESQPPPAAVK